MSGTNLFRPLESHPIPFDQEEINDLWDQLEDPAKGNPPSVDAAHEDYTRTIAEYGDWHAFRTEYPFVSNGVVFWNRGFGEGFVAPDSEGSWHELVNLFAEIVDAEGDCRDADFSGGLTQGGGHRQRCKKCGGSWVVG